MKMHNKTSVAATPMAKRLAREAGIDLSSVIPSGKHGEIVAADIEKTEHAGSKISMLAARIAKDQGIDPAGITGTGFHGKIMRRDVEACTEDMDSIIAEIDDLIEKKKMSGMRKAIARRMLQSHLEIPPVTQSIKVDVTDLLKVREQVNADRGKAERVSLNDLIIKAVAKCIMKFERFRMTLDENEYTLHSRINISVAVGLPDGLITPVLRDVDRMDIFRIAECTKEIIGKAHDGKLKSEDLSGGCITVSNIGMYGTHSFTPIINQPEASILGVCGVEDELALTDGAVCVRKKMLVCLTYDHRILNGTEVCEFELYLKKLLENPLSFIL